MTSSNAVVDSNKRLVYRFVDECWNKGNLALIPELVAGHCRYHDPVFPHMIAGVESLRQHIERCRIAFPDLKFTITDTIAEGNEVVEHWNANGTQRGEFLGMHATNQEAQIAGTSIFQLDEGKITEQWSNWNLMSLMEQLGMKTSPRKVTDTRSFVGWE